MTKVGKNIKKIRNIKGLSQQAFADLFQLTRGNISSYEELRAEPRIDVLVKIANYFSIPLADLIEKELSVNELLHYNTALVMETERLKVTQQLTQIPYVPILYINDYIAQFANEDFLLRLPQIIVPSNSRFRLIAIEIENTEHLPSGFDYKNGDILVYEEVVKENIHRITGKLGMMVSSEGLKWGVYQENENTISLTLNNWVGYDFDIHKTDAQYWMLKAAYMQE